MQGRRLVSCLAAPAQLVWLAAAAATVAIGLAFLVERVDSTAALVKDTADVPSNTFSAGSWCANIYVWDMSFTSRTRGPGGSMHDEGVTVTIRQDSNLNCLAEAADSPVSGASVTVELRDQGGSVVASDGGTTKPNGTYTTSWFTDLPDGTYSGWVTVLSHSSYGWDDTLDVVNPVSHAIPH